MRKFEVVHTVNSNDSEKESIKQAAARALYAELLKYYSAKNAAEKTA